jgi:uncharacterized membrane protein YgcG
MADGFVPPQQVRANAKRGLELRKEHNRGGTEVGVARARDLSNGAALSLDTIKRMNSYFARHEVDKKGEGWGVDSAGYIAWLLWGGDAGWSWARGILRANESKEKSTVNDLTTSYFSIEKADRQPDGTLMVYGKATDDSVDIDQQICDAAWLDRAMPAWFKSGGNIREQHSSIAAGVAKEYEAKADGHYIMAHVVDPVSVKKVDAGVLRGFSIGIKSPRVVRDQKAANGRIIDGQIVEVSLVDRPANPNCQLVLAKSVDGESSLIQVEELTEDIIKHPGHDQSSHGRGGGRAGAGAGAAGAAGGGGGGGGGSAGGGESGGSSKPKRSTSRSKAGKTVDDAEDEMDEAYKKTVRAAGNNPTGRANVMDAAQTREDASGHIDDARNAIFRGNTAGAVSALNNASKIMSDEPSFKPAAKKLSDLASELQDNPLGKSTDAELRKALQSALHLLSLTKSEETSMKDTVELPVEAIGDLLKFDKAQYEAAREALANLISIEAGEMREGHNEIQSIGHLLEAVMHLHAWYEGEEAEGEVVEEETIIERAAGSDKEMKPAKDEKKPDFLKRCKEAGMDDDAAKACWDKYMAADTDEVDAEKSAEISKCLECGCNQPGTDHGLTVTNDFANVAKPSHVTTAEMYAPGETPKSAEGEEPEVKANDEEVKAEEVAEEAPATEAVEATENSAEVNPADVEAIVEQVVKSATQSLKSEIAELVAAKEAALSKAVGLEAELELAKSLAVAGGPSRTAKPINVKTTNDLLTKAAIYKAKANATTDPTLAKGYKTLAEEFLAKAAEADNK